jgi:hypothetical protein
MSEGRGEPFPALQKILGEKTTTRYDNLTSVSGTIFEQFELFLNIAEVVQENKDDLLEAATADRRFGCAAVDDLLSLSEQLERISWLFRHESNKMRNLCSEITLPVREGNPFKKVPKAAPIAQGNK